jgi:hypothetical protein
MNLHHGCGFVCIEEWVWNEGEDLSAARFRIAMTGHRFYRKVVLKRHRKAP